MQRSLTLALDIGTSSVRASLYDQNADPLPRASVKVPTGFTSTIDGGSEFDAVRGFADVVLAIDTLLEKTSRLKADIDSVATCAFWHSLLGVDSKGKPTSKVLGWADTRSREQTAVLRKRFDEPQVHDRTGARFHSSYWPAKLLWFRKRHPDVFAKTAKWLSFSDYVGLKLFGNATTSVSMASGTGIFDIHQCKWDSELLRYLKIRPDSLSEIAADDAQTFKLSKASAKRWPRLANAEWFPAIGDGAADNIGSGCVGRDRAALMVGTSAAMRVIYEGDPPANVPDGLWCYRVDRKSVVIGGALSDGGGLYRWLKDNLRLPVDAEEQISRRPPGAHGITFLPFSNGERGTGYNENAAGAILGLTMANDPVDILQAAMESVAFRLGGIFEQLSPAADIKQIIASGGALRDSSIWSQIIADVLGRDLTLSGTEESSSRGAVLHALQSKGKIGGIDTTFLPGSELISARPPMTRAFLKLRKTHVSFYNQLNR